MTLFAKMLPIILAKVIPLQDPDETDVQCATRIAVGAHYAAIDALHTAIQPDIDPAVVSRSRNDAAAAGREIRDAMKALERRQKPAAPAKMKVARDPI
jgi:hypothetical protein